LDRAWAGTLDRFGMAVPPLLYATGSGWRPQEVRRYNAGAIMPADTTSNVLTDHGILELYHVTPLAYVPWIASHGQLLSKQRLLEFGFCESHWRSTSSNTDVRRGFASVVHLFSHSPAPLLLAKLGLGIPHVELRIPLSAVPKGGVHFCRYNIAKHRVRVFRESDINGRLRDPFRVPVATSPRHQRAMLRSGIKSFEVLIDNSLVLPHDLSVRAFSAADLENVRRVLARFGRRWSIEHDPNRYYPQIPHRLTASVDYSNQALHDPAWRGAGIQIDR
jgi:hypothetical protein